MAIVESYIKIVQTERDSITSFIQNNRGVKMILQNYFHLLFDTINHHIKCLENQQHQIVHLSEGLITSHFIVE